MGFSDTSEFVTPSGVDAAPPWLDESSLWLSWGSTPRLETTAYQLFFIQEIDESVHQQDLSPEEVREVANSLREYEWTDERDVNYADPMNPTPHSRPHTREEYEELVRLFEWAVENGAHVRAWY